MKQHLGLPVKLHLEVDNKNLFYTGIITEITDEHISFKDKFGKPYTFRISSVIEISPKEKE